MTIEQKIEAYLAKAADLDLQEEDAVMSFLHDKYSERQWRKAFLAGAVGEAT